MKRLDTCAQAVARGENERWRSFFELRQALKMTKSRLSEAQSGNDLSQFESLDSIKKEFELARSKYRTVRQALGPSVKTFVSDNRRIRNELRTISLDQWISSSPTDTLGMNPILEVLVPSSRGLHSQATIEVNVNPSGEFGVQLQIRDDRTQDGDPSKRLSPAMSNFLHSIVSRMNEIFSVIQNKTVGSKSISTSLNEVIYPVLDKLDFKELSDLLSGEEVPFIYLLAKSINKFGLFGPILQPYFQNRILRDFYGQPSVKSRNGTNLFRGGPLVARAPDDFHDVLRLYQRGIINVYFCWILINFSSFAGDDEYLESLAHNLLLLQDFYHSPDRIYEQAVGLAVQLLNKNSLESLKLENFAVFDRRSRMDYSNISGLIRDGLMVNSDSKDGQWARERIIEGQKELDTINEIFGTSYGLLDLSHTETSTSKEDLVELLKSPYFLVSVLKSMRLDLKSTEWPISKLAFYSEVILMALNQNSDLIDEPAFIEWLRDDEELRKSIPKRYRYRWIRWLSAQWKGFTGS